MSLEIFRSCAPGPDNLSGTVYLVQLYPVDFVRYEQFLILE